MEPLNVLASPLTHIKPFATIVLSIGLVFWLWFGVSMHHEPPASYPYYDIQKPVPPWSEPMPLEGNYNRAGERK